MVTLAMEPGMSPRRWVVLLAGAATVALAGCDEGVGITEDLVTPVDSTTTFLLTDSPFPYDLLARVDIYVEEVAVSVTADTGTIQDSTGAEFVTAVAPHRRINVLDLQHGAVDTLRGTKLPPLDYQSLKLVINADSSSITLKDGQVLTRASSPGINWQLLEDRSLVTMWALVPAPLSVADTGGTIVVDLDVGRNFTANRDLPWGDSTDDGFLSFNIVRAVMLERSGTIIGRAVDSLGVSIVDATVTAFLTDEPEWPEDTWSVVATSRTDASGNFAVAYLTPTDWYDAFSPHHMRYAIGVDGTASSGVGSARYLDIALSAGKVRDVGTIVLPRF